MIRKCIACSMSGRIVKICHSSCGSDHHKLLEAKWGQNASVVITLFELISKFSKECCVNCTCLLFSSTICHIIYIDTKDQHAHHDVTTLYTTWNEQHIHYRGVLWGLYNSLWKIVSINTCTWVWHDKACSYEQTPNNISHNEIGAYAQYINTDTHVPLWTQLGGCMWFFEEKYNIDFDSS